VMITLKGCSRAQQNIVNLPFFIGDGGGSSIKCRTFCIVLQADLIHPKTAKHTEFYIQLRED